MSVKKLLTPEQKAILAAHRFFENLEGEPFGRINWSFFHPLGIMFGLGEKPIEVAVAASEWEPTRGCAGT